MEASASFDIEVTLDAHPQLATSSRVGIQKCEGCTHSCPNCKFAALAEESALHPDVVEQINAEFAKGEEIDFDSVLIAETPEQLHQELKALEALTSEDATPAIDSIAALEPLGDAIALNPPHSTQPLEVQTHAPAPDTGMAQVAEGVSKGASADSAHDSASAAASSNEAASQERSPVRAETSAPVSSTAAPEFVTGKAPAATTSQDQAICSGNDAAATETSRPEAKFAASTKREEDQLAREAARTATESAERAREQRAHAAALAADSTLQPASAEKSPVAPEKREANSLKEPSNDRAPARAERSAGQDHATLRMHTRLQKPVRASTSDTSATLRRQARTAPAKISPTVARSVPRPLSRREIEARTFSRQRDTLSALRRQSDKKAISLQRTAENKGLRQQGQQTHKKQSPFPTTLRRVARAPLAVHQRPTPAWRASSPYRQAGTTPRVTRVPNSNSLAPATRNRMLATLHRLRSISRDSLPAPRKQPPIEPLRRTNRAPLRAKQTESAAARETPRSARRKQVESVVIDQAVRKIRGLRPAPIKSVQARPQQRALLEQRRILQERARRLASAKLLSEVTRRIFREIARCADVGTKGAVLRELLEQFNEARSLTNAERISNLADLLVALRQRRGASEADPRVQRLLRRILALRTKSSSEQPTPECNQAAGTKGANRGTATKKTSAGKHITNEGPKMSLDIYQVRLDDSEECADNREPR